MKKYIVKLTLGLMLSAAFITACTDDDDDDQAIAFGLSTEELVFGKWRNRECDNYCCQYLEYKCKRILVEDYTGKWYGKRRVHRFSRCIGIGRTENSLHPYRSFRRDA